MYSAAFRPARTASSPSADPRGDHRLRPTSAGPASLHRIATTLARRLPPPGVRAAVGREQLLDVLLSAFEDVVHLNDQYHASAIALRSANRKLEQHNVELRRLAESERRAHDERKRAETQLVQNEKATALGQMVAGVTHEINNPLAFVINNIALLRRDFGCLEEMLRLHQETMGPLSEHCPELLEKIRDHADDIDLPYTLENLGCILERTHQGAKRIQRIVTDLRDFARLDESEQKEADLNEGIASTLNLIRGRAAELKVELAAELEPLPRLSCYPAKINQVVLSLVNNGVTPARRGPGHRCDPPHGRRRGDPRLG